MVRVCGHLVVNSSTCGINLKQIPQQLHDVVGLCVFFFKILNLCWKSSISLATN